MALSCRHSSPVFGSAVFPLTVLHYLGSVEFIIKLKKRSHAKQSGQSDLNSPVLSSATIGCVITTQFCRMPFHMTVLAT